MQSDYMPEMLRIAAMSTSITQADMLDAISDGVRAAHESLTRSYHILAKVRYMLEQNTPPSVILECIDVMQSGSEPEESDLSEKQRRILGHLTVARMEVLTNLKIEDIKRQEIEAEEKARIAAEQAGRG